MKEPSAILYRQVVAEYVLSRSRQLIVLTLLLFLALATIFQTRLTTAAPVWQEGQQPTATNVSGPITADTVWTVANSPYIMTGNVTVNSGVRLTIEPGVEVQSQQSYSLVVQGTLEAVGTAGSPILFTGTSAVPGHWGGLSVDGSLEAPAAATLAHVTIAYGGRSSGQANLMVADHATVTLDQGQIMSSAHEGILVYDGSVNVSNSHFADNVEEVLVYNNISSNPQLANLSAAGNGTDAVVLRGSTSPAQTWRAAGLPYVLRNYITVPADHTLTVEPGVTVYVEQAVTLTVNGTLQAVGTAADPIVFSGTSLIPGHWGGIYVSGSASKAAAANLEHVTIAYGGRGSGQANLMVLFGKVTLAQATIQSSAQAGITVSSGGGADVSDTHFQDNVREALVYSDISSNPQLANLSAARNGTDAVVLRGTTSPTQTWRAAGLPYVLRNYITVPAGHTLTVEPGVTMYVEQAVTVTVNGTLQAAGTAANPIQFTGTSLIPGHWGGIYVNGSASKAAAANLEHVTIAYGGRGSGQANLMVLFGKVTLAQATIQSSAQAGMAVSSGGGADVSDTHFQDNVREALVYSDISKNPQLANLSAEGNGADVVVLRGTTGAEQVWRAAGLPYVLRNYITIPAGHTLTVEPGVSMYAEQAVTMNVAGRLEARGTAAAPILFSATSPIPGHWGGLNVNGTSARRAEAYLEHASVLYGGRGTGQANVYANNAVLRLTDSRFAFSAHDGLSVRNIEGGSVIERNSITSNTGYALRNWAPSLPVMAPDNWWGSASGPVPDQIACNPTGSGGRVSAGVLFQPYRTAEDSPAGEVVEVSYAQVQLTPERWFVPGDGVTRAVIQVAAYDKNGAALTGVPVVLSSSMGTVAPRTGTTNHLGTFVATVVSSQAGEAVVTAMLSSEQCEGGLPAQTTITFIPFDPAGELMEGAAAPYLNNRIQINPEPIVRGVQTKVSVSLSNDNDFPVLVNGSFVFYQSGIGQVSGPIAQVEGIVIPAMSDTVVEIEWVPVVSGHYCIRFEYAWRADTSNLAAGSLAPDTPTSGSGGSMRNLQVRPAPFLKDYDDNRSGPPPKDSLKKAEKATNALSDASFAMDVAVEVSSGGSNIISNFLGGQMVSNILGFNFDSYGAANCALAGGGNCGGWKGPRFSMPFGSLSEDPPSQEYEEFAAVDILTLPTVQAGPQMPAARAAAINELLAGISDMTPRLVAAAVSLDRYAGAAEAGNLEWSALQASAYLHYLRTSAESMLRVADALDALVAQAQSEGLDVVVTPAMLAEYQQRLREEGFTAEELEAARAVGLTDETIEAIRQRRMNAEPAEETTAGELAAWTALADSYREVATGLLAVPGFGGSMTGGMAPAAEVPEERAQIYGSTFEVVVGNPLAEPQTISLTLRSLNLPWDWHATVSTPTVTLEPGEETTVTVRVTPGQPAVQETQASVAVEGYIGNELLGGVVLQVTVPGPRPFTPPSLDTNRTIYLPAIVR